MNFLTSRSGSVSSRSVSSRFVARPLLFLRANSSATPLNKQRGFIQYERDTDGYRSATDRVSDWSEINTDPADRNPAERKRQAARCMDCGTPFCFTYTGCPINNPIPQFNNLVFEDQWREAAAQLFATNNFPEFTGRVCPAPCEGSCISGIVEDPVTIKDIEYSIVDRAFREGWVQPRVPQHRSGRRVAVVGSGPTGLAAADMLNQAGHTVRVLERADEIGGLLQYGIPNMKLDKRTVKRRVELLELEGIEFEAGCHVGVDFDSGDLLRDFDSVVLAMGSTMPRDLEIPGRHLEGVHFAMDFLTENQKALHYGQNGQEDPKLNVGWNAEVNEVCGHIHAGGKHVVVVGGGDTGTDCIATSVRHGAISVTNMELLERPPDERAENNPWPEWPRVFSVDYGHAEVLARDGEEPRHFSMVSKRFVPRKDDDTKLGGIEVAKVNWMEGSPIEVSGSEKIIKADLAVLAMGFVSPEQTIVEQLELATDGRKNILADNGDFSVHSKANGTPVPGVFAAGDCRRGQSLVVWAIHEGRGVASAVNEYLNSLGEHEDSSGGKVVGL